MIVSIHQPNFLPWIGYFVKMSRSDVFVFLDNVQFTKGGFINRVKVKNKNGEASWLTVPVKPEGRLPLINELAIDYSKPWQKDIENKLKDYYRTTPFLEETIDIISDTLVVKNYPSLAHLNRALVLKLAEVLRINTKLLTASDMHVDSLKNNELLIAIITKTGAGTYLSGTGAKKYMDESLYEKAGIAIKYNNVLLRDYPQANGQDFLPNMSIVDALFNIGVESTRELILSATS